MVNTSFEGGDMAIKFPLMDPNVVNCSLSQ